jgi:hypothetical protein
MHRPGHSVAAAIIVKVSKARLESVLKPPGESNRTARNRCLSNHLHSIVLQDIDGGIRNGFLCCWAYIAAGSVVA